MVMAYLTNWSLSLQKKKRGLTIVSLILFKNNDVLSLFQIIDIVILYATMVSKIRIRIISKYWLY